jgi:hypothetical protein
LSTEAISVRWSRCARSASSGLPRERSSHGARRHLDLITYSTTPRAPLPGQASAPPRPQQTSPPTTSGAKPAHPTAEDNPSASTTATDLPTHHHRRQTCAPHRRGQTITRPTTGTDHRAPHRQGQVRTRRVHIGRAVIGSEMDPRGGGCRGGCVGRAWGEHSRHIPGGAGVRRRGVRWLLPPATTRPGLPPCRPRAPRGRARNHRLRVIGQRPDRPPARPRQRWNHRSRTR